MARTVSRPLDGGGAGSPAAAQKPLRSESPKPKPQAQARRAQPASKQVSPAAPAAQAAPAPAAPSSALQRVTQRPSETSAQLQQKQLPRPARVSGSSGAAMTPSSLAPPPATPPPAPAASSASPRTPQEPVSAQPRYVSGTQLQPSFTQTSPQPAAVSPSANLYVSPFTPNGAGASIKSPPAAAGTPHSGGLAGARPSALRPLSATSSISSLNSAGTVGAGAIGSPSTPGAGGSGSGAVRRYPNGLPTRQLSSGPPPGLPLLSDLARRYPMRPTRSGGSGPIVALVGGQLMVSEKLFNEAAAANSAAGAGDRGFNRAGRATYGGAGGMGVPSLGSLGPPGVPRRPLSAREGPGGLGQGAEHGIGSGGRLSTGGNGVPLVDGCVPAHELSHPAAVGSYLQQRRAEKELRAAQMAATTAAAANGGSAVHHDAALRAWGSRAASSDGDGALVANGSGSLPALTPTGSGKGWGRGSVVAPRASGAAAREDDGVPLEGEWLGRHSGNIRGPTSEGDGLEEEVLEEQSGRVSPYSQQQHHMARRGAGGLGPGGSRFRQPVLGAASPQGRGWVA